MRALLIIIVEIAGNRKITVPANVCNGCNGKKCGYLTLQTCRLLLHVGYNYYYHFLEDSLPKSLQGTHMDLAFQFGLGIKRAGFRQRR